MKVARSMTRDVVCVSPAHSIANAYGLMTEWCIRHLPVVDGRRLVGILSDRDLLLSGMRTGAGIAFPPQAVGEVMTPHPLTCRRGTTIGEAAGLMLDHKVDSLPVVDLDGELIGMLTTSDLMELLRDRESSEAQVETLPFMVRLAGLAEAVAP